MPDPLPDDEKWVADVVDYRHETLAEQRAPKKPPKANGEDPGGVANLLAHAFWIVDTRERIDVPYVIKGIFGKGDFVVFWGAPGSGKSFNALELAFAVGSGLPWRGRRTRRGIVIYVAAESSRARLENRIVALRREWPEAAEAEVLVVPLALDLLHTERGDVDRVIETAKVLAKEVGEVALIVIDTLAVTFGGGNENSPEDMGAYVANVQAIKGVTGTAVLLVHHCGKDEARGMRGHSALLGALDAELAIEGPPGGQRILRTGKVRDGDGYADLFAFALRVVDLGTDQDGDPVRTCVVDGLDEAATKRARRSQKGAGLGKNQKAVLRVLEAAGGRMPRLDLAHKLRDEGMPKNRVYDALGGLLESGMLIAHNDRDPPEVALA